MKTLYIVSTEPYAGKGWISLMLGMRFKEKGKKISYFRPIGTIPVKCGNLMTDEDALYFNELLGLKADKKYISPILLTDKTLDEVVSDQTYRKSGQNAFARQIMASYKKLSAGGKLVIVGGAGSLFVTGKAFNLSTTGIADMLDSGVIVVTKYNAYMVDSILTAKELLKERLLGVVINSIPKEKLALAKKEFVPYFRKHGIEVLGTFPHDSILSAVSVHELVENLSAEVICGKDKLDNLVENFCVGAMNINAALKYFRQIPNKAVITGGDRADLQISALETPTVCLILTGNLYPSSAIIGQAESLGVPILLVKTDTLSTVEKIEGFLTRLPIRGKKKIDQGTKLFNKYFNFDRLFSLMKMK